MALASGSKPFHGCWDKVLPCPLYLRRLCLLLHFCWQAQPTKINRTRHSLVRTTGLHIKSTNSTFRPCGTAVACIRVFGRILIQLLNLENNNS
ncbi:MAG: hypothetical protein LBD59_06195 [Prevotellaceae bacterium]|nr:hypothetical protein [Prevotellaceae bacterium]